MIKYISAVLLVTATLALVSIHTITGKIYAIEQPSTMAGINEEQCPKGFNCKIMAKNVTKYPDVVSPFDKSEEIGKLMPNNLHDTKKIQEQSCEKLMNIDIEKTKDQQAGEQMPKYLICLP